MRKIIPHTYNYNKYYVKKVLSKGVMTGLGFIYAFCVARIYKRDICQTLLLHFLNSQIFVAKIFDLFYNFSMKRIIIVLLIAGITFTSNCYALTFPKGKPAQEQTLQNPKSQQARVLYAQNEIDEALDLLTQIPEQERSAQDWLLMGNVMQDKENIDQALYMFNKSVQADPKFYKSHYNLGYIYLSKNQPNMALEEFKLAVKYKPDFSYGYYNIGCSYLKLKKYSLARYNFFRSLNLRANEPNVYYNIAYTYKKQGKQKQAQEYLDLYNKMTEDHDL